MPLSHTCALSTCSLLCGTDHLWMWRLARVVCGLRARQTQAHGPCALEGERSNTRERSRSNASQMSDSTGQRTRVASQILMAIIVPSPLPTAYVPWRQRDIGKFNC